MNKIATASEHRHHHDEDEHAFAAIPTTTTTSTKTTSTPVRIPKPPKGGWIVHKTTGQFDDRENLSQLHLLISHNPVLKIIKEKGAKTPKRILFPGDSSCNYFFEYLRHFPPGTWAMPQVFCRLIKGLNSNHWLALTAMRFRERRHLTGNNNNNNNNSSEAASSPAAEYGMLRSKEVTRLRAANQAFWDHYVQSRPDDAQMVKLKQRSNNRNKLLEESRGNKRKSLSSGGSASLDSSDEPQQQGSQKKTKKPRVQDSNNNSSSARKQNKTLMVAAEEEEAYDEVEDDDEENQMDQHHHHHHQNAYVDTMEGNVSRTVTPTLGTGNNHGNSDAAVLVTPGLAPTPDARWKVSACGQFEDRNNLDQLQEIIDMNPVLEYIQDKGGSALKKDLFPEGDDFFYEYLESFPPGTWAVPQVFCRVIKKLSSAHWLTRIAMRLRERRHKGKGEYGSLKPKEVMRLKRANPAFFHYYVNAKDEGGKLFKGTESVESDPQDHSAQDSMHSANNTEHDEHASHPDNHSRSNAREHAVTQDFAAAVSDPILQRQILEEHLLRASLQQQQQQRALLLQHFPEHAAALGGHFGAGAGGLGGVLPPTTRDTLPFLAALGGGQSYPLAGAGAPPGESSATYQALASLLSSSGASAFGLGNSLQSLLPPNQAALASPLTARPQEQNYQEKDDAGDYTNSLQYKAAAAFDESKNSGKFAYSSSRLEDTADAEAFPQEASPPAREGKRSGMGDFSMLDILAATASAARLEVVGAD